MFRYLQGVIYFNTEIPNGALPLADGMEPAAEPLYKLDCLSAMGGLRTRSMLVSYQALKDFEKRRAQDLHIKPVVGGEIVRLPEILRQWLGTL